jgi:hypothetical protein
MSITDKIKQLQDEMLNLKEKEAQAWVEVKRVEDLQKKATDIWLPYARAIDKIKSQIAALESLNADLSTPEPAKV